MSDFGIFEADEAAANEPRRQARTAARKLDAAIDAVRVNFGRFLLGATGIDEFEDRWHLSKNDIRASVEPLVFPNTGTMRRIQNAMKSDWKLAHPYKLAIDHDDAGFGSMPEGDSHRNQDLDETYSPSSGNLVPSGDFEGYKNSVDQDGPAKVESNDFTPGGDSGSDRQARRRQATEWKKVNNDGYPAGADGGNMTKAERDRYNAEEDEKHGLNREARIDVEAAKLVADIYTDFAQSNGLRVASMRSLDAYASTGIAEADYRILANLIRIAEEEAEKAAESDDEADSDDEGDDYDFGGESGSEGDDEASDDDDSDEDESDDDDSGDDDYDFGGGEDDSEGAEGGGQTYTVPDEAPDLDPQLLNEIPHDDPQGAAPVPPEVIDSLLGLPEGTIEQLLLEEVEQGQGGAPEQGGAPDFGGGDQGAPQGGGDDFLGQGGDDAEQEPPRVARRRRNARSFWAAEGDEQQPDAGGQQAPPAQDPNAGAAPQGDPAAMGGQPMMPPPGSGAVAPPAPPQQLEDQPAEDALLDTANQAIMQMIDRETQEYQQIIDPLSQALQAIQFAQQVEQSEHPMDVTPPEGTVDVSPAAAPGGAQSLQQQASRRVARETREVIFPSGAKGREWDCHNCGAPVSTSGGRDTSCRECDAQYNGFGQRLRDNWRDNSSNYDEDTGDMEGYEDSFHDAAKHARLARKKKVALRNAATVIAQKHRLSATGEQMLIEAMGRGNYEHVREALQAVPREYREAPANHIGHLFAADNPRFSRDQWMRSVMASSPRDRAGDAWRDGRDRGVAEHGRHDMDDDNNDDDLYAGYGRKRKGPMRPGASEYYQSDEYHNASRGRLPFDRPRTAGETLVPTATLDSYEHQSSGVPEVSDNLTSNDLPKMKGAEPNRKAYLTPRQADVMKSLQTWLNKQKSKGLADYGDTAAEGFLNTRKKPLGPRATQMVHDTVGAPAHPVAEAAPAKVRVPKAVNPVTKKGSFFTRRVPGWKWDDHLSGYISKEARTFTCSCGETVGSPSYKTCKCGKIWNVYAIGDTHHLASDTADMYVAREIPVRDNVIMANRKLAGRYEFADEDDADLVQTLYYRERKRNPKFREQFPSLEDYQNHEPFRDDGYDPHGGEPRHASKLAKDGGCTCWEGYERVPGTEPCASKSCRKKTSGRKLAGEESTWQLPENLPDKPGKPKNYFATGPCGQCGGRVHDDSTFGGDPICENCLDEVYGESGQPPPSADGWNPDEKQDPFDPRLMGASRRAQASFKQYLAEIERLADWTKYDGPDPSRDPKAKPPSTKIPKQPKDWTKRTFTGPDKGKWTSESDTFTPKKK